MVLLDDITVLDLSRILSGPICAMTLGDLGANVIKIEDPINGDEARSFPPFQNGVSTFFMAANRNKRGLTLDLRQKEGLEIFYKLVMKSDIVIESYRTGTTEKLRIDYNTVKKINPKIIYCSISGFGRKGPRSHLGGYDLMVQAFGGLMSITGTGSEHPPVRAGYSVADITTGMNAVMAIFVALYNRLKTGDGQLIEASLLQSQVGLMSYYATTYFYTKQVPYPRGSAHPYFTPYQAFKAKDGYVVIGVANERLWKKFCSLPGLENLKEDPRFATNEVRLANQKQLVLEIESVTSHYTKQHLINELEILGVPCSSINNIAEVISDPQVVFNKMIIEMDHPIAGKFLTTTAPFAMENINFVFNRYPPVKGEHNFEILEEIGFNNEEIKILGVKGVI